MRKMEESQKCLQNEDNNEYFVLTFKKAFKMILSFYLTYIAMFIDLLYVP